jgi:two-component system CitB family sensor kinase
MRKLFSQIFVAQLAIPTVTVAAGFVLFARAERNHFDFPYQARAAAIVETVADTRLSAAVW